MNKKHLSLHLRMIPIRSIINMYLQEHLASWTIQSPWNSNSSARGAFCMFWGIEEKIVLAMKAPLSLFPAPFQIIEYNRRLPPPFIDMRSVHICSNVAPRAHSSHRWITVHKMSAALPSPTLMSLWIPSTWSLLSTPDTVKTVLKYQHRT